MRRLLPSPWPISNPPLWSTSDVCTTTTVVVLIFRWSSSIRPRCGSGWDVKPVPCDAGDRRQRGWSHRSGKFAFFLFLFGVWDIFYYIWLKVFIHWPASLLTWDVLFLIPVPWVGPVYAPVSVACTMIGMALVMLQLEARGPVQPAGKLVWLAQVVACLIIIVSFTMDVIPRLDAQGARLAQWIPTIYRWERCCSLARHWLSAPLCTGPVVPGAPRGKWRCASPFNSLPHSADIF